MPGYKAHLTGGLFVYAVILFCVHEILHPPIFLAAEWLLFILAGSLFPDVDVKSKGQHLLYSGIFVLFAALLVYGCHETVAILALLSLIPMLVKHRGLFHNIWFVILFPLAVAWAAAICFPNYAHAIFFDALFFIAGALSHLWLDLGLRRMFR